MADYQGLDEADVRSQLDYLYRQRDELRAAAERQTEPEAQAEIRSMYLRNRAQIRELSAESTVDGSGSPANDAFVEVKTVALDGDDATTFVGDDNALDPDAHGNAPTLVAMAESRSTISRREQIVPWLLLGLFVLAVASVLAVSFNRSSEPDETGSVATVEETNDAESVDSTVVASADDLADVRAVLAGLGLGSTQVEERNGALHLVGSAPTEADRVAAIGAVGALAGGRPVDASLLTVAATTPTTPSTLPVDQAARLHSELNRLLAATPLIFGTGEIEVNDLHRRILDQVVTIVGGYGDTSIVVVGFTDSVGDAAQNRRVSLARANGVRDYLVSKGLGEDSLAVDARGEEGSVGSAALANLERRVEFEVAGASAAATVAAAASPLSVTVVTPSAADDLAFSQSMVDAVNAVAQSRGGAEVSIVEGKFVVDEATAIMRERAEQGADLIIAHGSQYGASLLQLAKAFPETSFAWGTASDNFGLPNVYAYDVAADEGGYVLGALAASLSESKVLGAVGPIEIGDAQLYINGFARGARAEVGRTDVRIAYTSSFSDTTLAAEAAQAHIAAGADVLTGTAQMVVGAVSAAQSGDALWFGNQSNQASLAPSLVVASQVYHWEVIIGQIVADIDSGTVSGRTYTADLANGGIVIEYNPSFELPAEARQRADVLIQRIKDGAIATR